MPFLTVIGGPNGSGKSTLTDYLIKQGVNFGSYVNADEIARRAGLGGDAGAMEAQAAADALRERHFGAGVDFAFETVMSHPSKVAWMRRARDAGYEVTLYFVATGDPQINIARVAQRVALGGHDVPVDRILGRYARSIGLLAEAMTVCTRTVVFDNSGDARNPTNFALRPVMEAVLPGPDELQLRFLPPVPIWVVNACSLAQFGFYKAHYDERDDGSLVARFVRQPPLQGYDKSLEDRLTMDSLRPHLRGMPRRS